MATALDHSQNIKARLLERLKDLEREVQETRELLDAQDRIDKLVGSGSLPKATVHPIESKSQSGGRMLQNRNITALVREFIDNYVKEDEAIEVPALTKDWLIAKHGVKGAYRNIYAQVHVILKKETLSNERKTARLFHVRGSGYFKRKQD